MLETLPQDDTEALNALGIAYGQAGRAADAMRAFTRALELDATNGLAHQNIGTLHLRAGDLAAAEASLRKPSRSIRPSPAPTPRSAWCSSRRTGGADAIDAWKRAVDLEPTEYDALYNLTIELVNAGRLDEARQYGERYIAHRAGRRSMRRTLRK